MASRERNSSLDVCFKGLSLPIFLTAGLLLWPSGDMRADASGKFVYTKRFDEASVVLEVSWTYVRATPSLTFGTPRVIWSGAGAPDGEAGSDGLFFNPAGDLIVGNWESHNMWKFDPTQTDVVIDGPAGGGNALAFHSLLHPNLNDFLATNAFGNITCGDVACFGVYDHTPLDTSRICQAPKELTSNDLLQPVTFAADQNNNVFTIFSDGRTCSGCPADSGIQFGGGGFASFNLATTSSTSCSNAMQMKRLIPQEISAAHSMSWDPFLSNANDSSDPHSDFLVFANSRVSHVRVDDPGTPGASAQVVSTVDMATESSCASRLPSAPNEFDQGAVTESGVALVGDEATGYIALIDYSQNTNGTIRDPGRMVCLTKLLSAGIDDIGPLTGLGADPRLHNPNFQISAGLNDAWYNPVKPGQGFFINVFPDLGTMFLAWFTYDTSRPPGSVNATLGEPGHRWLTAYGPYADGQAVLDIEITENGVFNASSPPVSQHADGTVTLDFDTCNRGTLTYNIPSVNKKGTIPIERVSDDNVAACQQAASAVQSAPSPKSLAGNRAEALPQAEGFQINRGLNDAWFNPATNGQGFFMNVFPGLGQMFLAWFTFDTARPPGSVNANLADPGHRWLTAFGPYTGNVAELDIELTQGGVFDSATPATSQHGDGTVTVNMTDCAHGTIHFDIDSANRQGDIPIQRLANDNVPLCQSLDGL